MMKKRLPILLTSVLAFTVVLAGCTPAEETVTPATPESSVSTPAGEETAVPEEGEVTETEEFSGEASLDVVNLADGQTLTYPVNTLIYLNTEDPTQVTLISADSAVAAPENIPAGNEAGYTLGLRVKSTGTTQVEVYNSATDSTVNLTVTGS